MSPYIRCAALALSLAGAASAATIVQTRDFAFVPNGSQVLTFNEFDTLGGERTLLSVTVIVEFTKSGGSYSIDNDSNVGGTINLTHQVVGSLSSTKPLFNDAFLPIFGTGTLEATSTLNNVTIGATTGDPTDQFNATGGADNVVFAPADVTDSHSGAVASIAQSSYIGTGTYTMTFGANQLVSATGLGGLQQAIVVSEVSGTVTVIYEYVPEPSSALLGATGLLFLLRRRRH